MSEEERANSFMREADKKARSSKILFTRTSKIEEACELYTRAANAFKMAKNWTAAGKAFTEAAKLQLDKLKCQHEAATQYVEAAKCYKKGDPQEAIESFERANEIYNDMGKFSIAAKHNVTIAEIYESKELLDTEKAVIYYTQAADFYEDEQSTSSANKCLLKVAFYAALQENYKKAITIYEEIATASLDNTLLKYSARDYLFRSTLCRLCDSMETNPSSSDFIPNVIERYIQMCPPFEGCRELKFVEKIVQAQQEASVEIFTSALNEHNKGIRLDQWYTTLLLRIKSKISNNPFDVDDDYIDLK